MKTKRLTILDLGLVLTISSVVIWYMMDAYSASSKVSNLLLIFPIGFISLAFLIGILFQIIPTLVAKMPLNEGEKNSDEEKFTEKDEGRMVFLAMVFLALYVLVISMIGFDIATFLFIASMLFLQGERRLSWLILFPAVFALLVSLFFVTMIPYPMPMLMPTDWISGLI